MSARALAMEVNIEDYPEEVSELVNKLKLLKDKNENTNPVNGQLRGWINERLTILAVVPHLDQTKSARLIQETRKNLEEYFHNPYATIGSRSEPAYA